MSVSPELSAVFYGPEFQSAFREWQAVCETHARYDNNLYGQIVTRIDPDNRRELADDVGKTEWIDSLHMKTADEYKDGHNYLGEDDDLLPLYRARDRAKERLAEERTRLMGIAQQATDFERFAMVRPLSREEPQAMPDVFASIGLTARRLTQLNDFAIANQGKKFTYVSRLPVYAVTGFFGSQGVTIGEKRNVKVETEGGVKYIDLNPGYDDDIFVGDSVELGDTEADVELKVIQPNELLDIPTWFGKGSLWMLGDVVAGPPFTRQSERILQDINFYTGVVNRIRQLQTASNRDVALA